MAKKNRGVLYMSVTLAILRNPFDVRDRDILRVDIAAAQPFQDFLENHVRIGDEMEYHASINGRVYTPEEIPTQIVIPGDYVAVCPVLRGGGGNSGRSKNPLAILAGIALAIFSFGVVAPAVGSLFGGSALAAKLAGGLTLMVGGQLISNAFSPKVKEAEDTASHQWSALQPINQQGAMIPITYGTVRTAGQIINQYIRVEGDVQYMDMLLCGGEGPIDLFSDVRINDNPAENYANVTVAFRGGLNTQDPISGFENIYDTQYVGVTLNVAEGAGGVYDKDTPGEWMIFELEGNTADYLEVAMDFPEGLCNYGNDIEETSVYPEFEYSLQTGSSWSNWIPWFSEEIKAGTTKPITRVRRTEKLTSGRYRVRGRMNRVASTDAGHVRNKMMWTSLTAVVESPMIHPRKALVGISMQATDQLNGGSPTVTWKQTRATVLVYMNGQWVSQDAQNPAWIIYDLCVQARDLDGTVYVFGEQPERMDLTAFAAWAAWNDQTLGNRGPIKMNLLVDEGKDLWQWVNDIASSARGAVVMRGTRISCIWDQPADPVQLFTMGNIVANSFSGEFLPVDARANAVEISFLNEAKNYEREQITVYAHDFDDADTRANPVSVELTGITNFDSAWQEGLYRLNQNRYILRTITFRADVDAIACQVGDVILVQHDVPRWGQGGRILSVDGNNIIVDHNLNLDSGVTYNILVRRQSDDAILQRTATGSGATNQIVISNASGLAPYDVFAIGEMQAVAKPFRVQEISRSGDMEVTLTCTEYIAALYTEDGVPPIIDYSLPSNRIAGLTLNASGYYSSSGQWIPELWANWSYRGEKPASYQVEWKYDQGVWEQHRDTTETTAQCPLRDTAALYSVRVRALYVSAQPSDWAYATSEGIVLGNGIPPNPPTGLTAKGMFGFASLEWVNPSNPDLSHIEVWENNKDELMSASMVGQTRANSFTRVLPAGGTMWYWVRAVNYTGQKSEYNDQAGTPCIIDPESAEAWITDYLEKNPWLQDALEELNTRIEPLEIAIEDIEDIPDIKLELEEIKDIIIPDFSGQIIDNRNDIQNKLLPALDLVSAGVLRLADQADYVGDVFRWAGMEIYPDEGLVVIRAIEDLKTETGYQFTNIEQRLDAQEADINLKATRVYVDELAASLISSITVAEEWKFEGSLNGWTGQNAELTPDSAGMKYKITAESPSMTSPAINIDGGVNNIIGLQILQTTGEPDANIRIQYSTSNHGFSDEYMKRVDLLGGISITRSVQVNMHALTAGGDDWKNSAITGIRILIGKTIDAEYLITLVNVGQSSLDELLLEGLEMRITQAEVDINGAKAAIALKADETVVAGLQQRMNRAEIDIDGLNSRIMLKADQTTLDGVDARLKTAEIAIDALDGGILQQVLDYELLQDQIEELSAASLQNSVNEHEGQQERRVKLALAKEELNARIDDTNEAVATYRLQLLAVINENKAYYDNQITAIANDLSTEVGRREALQAQVGENKASIVNEQKARADADNAMSTRISTLQTTVNGNTAAIKTEQTARTNADSSLTSQINTLRTTVNNNTAAIQNEVKARSDADTAESNARQTLTATVNANTKAINTEVTERRAAIQTEQKARADADNAVSSRINTLQTKVNSNASAIQSEATTRANADAAEASARQTLTATVNNNTKAIGDEVTARKAAIQSEAKTRADADSALSTRIDQVVATAGNNTAAIRTEQQTRASADSAISSSVTTLQTTVNGQSVSIQANANAVNYLNGRMSASYTIKVDNNGYVSGTQLLNGGAGKSAFVVNADSFLIAKPGSTNTKQMFVFDSTLGQLVCNSLMVNRAAIVDASVDTLKIAGRSVTMPVGLSGMSYVTWGYNHRDVIGTFYPILTALNYEAVVLGCPVIKNQEVWLSFTCGITAEMSTIWLRLHAQLNNSAGQQITGGGFVQDIPDVWSAFANERRNGSFSISTMFTPKYDGTLWVWPYWCVKYTHGSTSDTINFNRSSINDYSLLALQCKR